VKKEKAKHQNRNLYLPATKHYILKDLTKSFNTQNNQI